MFFRPMQQSAKVDVTRALAERTFLTYPGDETYLLYIQGFPLREFCAFEVFDDERAWRRMQDELLRPIAESAAAHGMGLLAGCLVWRASADYVTRLGAPGVEAVNRRAVERTRAFIDEWQAGSASARACPVIIAGDLGPRGDGYAVSGPVSVGAAYEYHAPQIEILARAGVDLLVPLTMTSLPETLGILRAAERAGLPALVSPTIETDGRLPDGTPLGDFVGAVDQATAGYPAGFMVNCVHPSHIAPVLRAAAERAAPWLSRFRGVRANASAKTHAELDNATALDRGDPITLARGVADLQRDHRLTIVGGCCGTDAEHLACIASACR
jgi:S-methylmethionine-dependent homocysteine/selenocysteine methylase